MNRARLQPQRGCVTKPRVGPKGQPWAAAMEGPSTPTGLWPAGNAGGWFSGHRAATPLGLMSAGARLPRVGAAPTLGFATQPRWGWSGDVSSSELIPSGSWTQRWNVGLFPNWSKSAMKRSLEPTLFLALPDRHGRRVLQPAHSEREKALSLFPSTGHRYAR